MDIPARTGKILVIRSGAIGDFIVTLPVLQLLRRTYSSRWLALVAKGRVRRLAEQVVDEFVDMDGRLLVPFFGDRPEGNAPECRYVGGFDLVISYLGKTGKMAENLLALRKPRVINADPLPPEGYGGHITEFLLEPLAEVMSVSSPPLPTVAIGEEEVRRAEVFLSANGIPATAPIIAVHPGSGTRPKVVPAGGFCRAVNWLCSRFAAAKVVVVEGEADEENVLAFERCLETACVRVRKESLLEVAAILSLASLFVGNDSGIAHLAAAVGVPTVVVFRASNPRLWLPRGRKVWVAKESTLQSVVVEMAKELFGPVHRGTGG